MALFRFTLRKNDGTRFNLHIAASGRNFGNLSATNLPDVGKLSKLRPTSAGCRRCTFADGISQHYLLDLPAICIRDLFSAKKSSILVQFWILPAINFRIMCSNELSKGILFFFSVFLTIRTKLYKIFLFIRFLEPDFVSRRIIPPRESYHSHIT